MEVCGWQGTGTKIGRLGAHVWSLTVVCVYGMTTASPQLMPCIHFFLSLVNRKRCNHDPRHCARLPQSSGSGPSLHSVFQAPHGVYDVWSCMVVLNGQDILHLCDGLAHQAKECVDGHGPCHCVQVIDIDDQGRCLAITSAGKEMTLSIPNNALGRSISIMCIFADG